MVNIPRFRHRDINFFTVLLSKVQYYFYLNFVYGLSHFWLASRQEINQRGSDQATYMPCGTLEI